MDAFKSITIQIAFEKIFLVFSLGSEIYIGEEGCRRHSFMFHSHLSFIHSCSQLDSFTMSIFSFFRVKRNYREWRTKRCIHLFTYTTRLFYLFIRYSAICTLQFAISTIFHVYVVKTQQITYIYYSSLTEHKKVVQSQHVCLLVHNAASQHSIIISCILLSVTTIDSAY